MGSTGQGRVGVIWDIASVQRCHACAPAFDLTYNVGCGKKHGNSPEAEF